MGRQLPAAVHRVSTGQMSCWVEQQQGEGSRVAEAERGHTVDGDSGGRAVEVGPGCKMTRRCCIWGPLWITELSWCKAAKT